jgi:hypothetical protein
MLWRWAMAYTAASAPPVEKLTFEEFLTRTDEDTWAEWVNGEVVIYG